MSAKKHNFEKSLSYSAKKGVKMDIIRKIHIFHIQELVFLQNAFVRPFIKILENINGQVSIFHQLKHLQKRRVPPV